MEHFIDTVRKYPCLWNTTAIEYRDQELKDVAWTEVMKETELSSVKEVKLKWKKLRDSYRDALKRQNEMLAKDPDSHKKNYSWKYMEQMQFLQPHMSNRKKPADGGGFAPPAAPDNGHQNGDRSTDESDSEPESSLKRKSCERLTMIDQKLEYLCKAQQSKRACPEGAVGGAGGGVGAGSGGGGERRREGPQPAPDPLDIFFNSMCQTTKRFPFPTQIKIKRRLFEAVTEAEEALVAEQQSYASLWARAPSSSSSSDEDESKPS